MALVHARVWTDRQGRTFEGEMLDQTREHILVRRAVDGREGWLAIRILSDADQAFVRSQANTDPEAEDAADVPDASAIDVEAMPEADPEPVAQAGDVEALPEPEPEARADDTEKPADPPSLTAADPAPKPAPQTRRILVQQRPAPEEAADAPEAPSTSTQPVAGFWSTDLEKTLQKLEPGKGLMVLYRHRADPDEFQMFLEQVMADPDVYRAFKGQVPLVVLDAQSQLLEDHLDARLLERNEGPFIFGLAPDIGDEPVLVRWPLKNVTEAHRRDALRGKQAFLDRLEPVFLRLNLGIERALAQAARAAPTPNTDTANPAAQPDNAASAAEPPNEGAEQETASDTQDAPADDTAATETASDAPNAPAAEQPAG
ncbi:MAG: hypothetical protein ACFB20_08855 [Opitutales bacterium]